MSETLTATNYDPALWAEAVAWQQECGVSDLLMTSPVNTFELRASSKSAANPAETSASRPTPTQAAPTQATPGKRPLPPPPKIASAYQHARRGLEAVDDIAEAEKRAAACSTLEELHEAIQAFEGCLLKETASHTVFADGQTESDILIIGGAPGADEDRQGKPFVGESGQLLDTMLAFIGLSRETNVRLTNIVFWRPPGNRQPNASEVAMCWPFSKRHIELVQPKVILAVGGLSSQTMLTPALRITRDRGKWKTFEVNSAKVPLLPTLNPDYLLKQPINKREAWHDLLLLKHHLSENKVLTP